MYWGIIGLVVGGAVGYLIGKRNATAGYSDSEKAQNLTKLRELIVNSDEKITNDLVQAELKISDSTATRYLQDLEKEGLIKQIGTEGKSVYYQKV